MRKLVLGMFVSLDGFVSGPKGEADWIFRSGDDATDAWIIDNLWEAGVLAMGSRSFSDMAAFWPTSDMPFAAPMNATPKAVFTRKGLVDASAVQSTTDTTPAPVEASGAPRPMQLVAGSWANPIRTGDLSDEVARLKAEAGKDVRVLGGASLARSLAAHGLIDEYRLLVCPVALGRGVPLFSGLSKPLDLHLVSARTFSGGAIGWSTILLESVPAPPGYRPCLRECRRHGPEPCMRCGRTIASGSPRLSRPSAEMVNCARGSP